MSRSSSSPEWVAFVHRIKPALRIGGDARRAEAHAEAARRRGFAAEVVAVPGARAAHAAIVYIARTPAATRTLRELESAILPTRERAVRPDDAVERHRQLGAALGFPACCVEAFVTRVERGVERMPDGSTAHEDFVAVTAARAASERLDPLLNMFPLGYSSPWLSHVPCRFDCDESLTYAARVRDTYTEQFPASGGQIAGDLAADVAITREGERVAPGEAPESALVLGFSNNLDRT